MNLRQNDISLVSKDERQVSGIFGCGNTSHRAQSHQSAVIFSITYERNSVYLSEDCVKRVITNTPVDHPGFFTGHKLRPPSTEVLYSLYHVFPVTARVPYQSGA